ncbi:hypothetical protein [Streptomyces sp. MH60]|uniref:hypothetical protein n=1 Tax=Streptomyces sp. MH60 TaxID=1940758 RepID=UPI000CEE697F|nr:hypothetical protein [Streptomyces sp. MH60]PPS89516.1 hypothetical protein BZZ08_01662 [Streptomyces sp. MH60]
MTANTSPAINFRRGGSAAAQAEKEDNVSSSGRRGPDFFGIKEDGESLVVRLLTDHDEWIWVKQHSFVPTKPGPKDAEKWPEAMTSVCRYDEAFGGHYKDCYICDAKIKSKWGKLASSRVRVWALVVERELVRGDGSEALGGPAKQGVVIGVRDKIDEIDELDADGKPTGVKLNYPRILVINQPMKGFFSHLKAIHGLNGTVVDRDFQITRDGKGTDTEYKFAAIDPIRDPATQQNLIAPGTPAWDKYLQAVAEREISLDSIVADKASDAYYARFFDPSKTVDKEGNVVAVAGGAVGMINVQSTDGPADISDDLRAKIANLGAPSA